jgi:hypothetical protein
MVFWLACFWALRTTRTHRAVCLGWLLASLLVIMSAGQVWESELSMWRAASVPLTLGMLVLIGARTPLAAPVMLLGSAAGLTMAARLILIAWRG